MTQGHLCPFYNCRPTLYTVFSTHLVGKGEPEKGDGPTLGTKTGESVIKFK